MSVPTVRRPQHKAQAASPKSVSNRSSRPLAAGPIMDDMKVVGTRHVDASPMADQAALARTTALLRGTPRLVPRGVYRFSSFDEADAWMTQMTLRTLEHQSLKTWSASAAP